MPARIAGRPLRERERPQDAKKWNERKDALEALHGVLNKPKLMKGEVAALLDDASIAGTIGSVIAKSYAP